MSTHEWPRLDTTPEGLCGWFSTDVKAAVDAVLTDRQRDAVVRHCVLGETFTEIASSRGVSVAVVQKAFTTATEKLRKSGMIKRSWLKAGQEGIG